MYGRHVIYAGGHPSRRGSSMKSMRADRLRHLCAARHLCEQRHLCSTSSARVLRTSHLPGMTPCGLAKRTSSMCGSQLMSGATVEDEWPRDNLVARSPRTVIYGIYAAAGKENRPVLNHFGIGDKKCGASLVGACTKIGTFDMPSMASMRAGRLISARYQALSHR
jgi:hypothetical protein